ncbi:uncharacterized protein N7498_005733 [Penicillium cinerascens]|uniref:Transcription factor domain-containing protein n=1 Tax=Penicillium cinerascens TaxID=70096 RepID=A0A9W9MP08_9EURO|nr:uncharacterized protein N7498_005733 [Penicillium cinerascens]KAJ5204854.1 hypothetical protein N7498_005733 [Penicillium cinerascens]
MFRDESKSVMRKAEAGSSSSSVSPAPSAPRQKRSPARSPRITSPDGSLTSELTVSVDPNSFDFNSDPQFDMFMPDRWLIPLEVQPPAAPSQQEAICYFLRSNAFPGTFWMSDFVTKFLTEPGGTVSQRAMQSSIVAVSSAMLSRVRKVNSLREVARKEYVAALNLLNTALADVEEAKTNQALGAVVLLAIYEVVTSRAPQDIDLWTNHITGATALLDLRGTEQLKTEAGLRLFMHLRYQITISCIQRDTRVPESLLECTKFAMFLRPSEAHTNRLVIIIGKLSNFRADLLAERFNNESEIIAAASAIEADLIAWLAALPPDFNYETLTKSPYDFPFQERCRGIATYDDQYHVYQNLWVCSTWNQYRCARIIVSEIILSHIRQMSHSSSLRSLSDEIRLHCKSLRSTIQRLSLDICRSVPFHLGANQKDASPNFPPPESYIGGLMLLWPLFLAGVVESPSHSQRRWVVSCLRMIGNTMGLDQALALMDIVASDPGILHHVLEEDESAITEEPAISAGSTIVPKKRSVSLINLPVDTIPASVDEGF